MLVDSKRLAEIKTRAQMAKLGQFHCDNPARIEVDRLDYARDVSDLVETLEALLARGGAETLEALLLRQGALTAPPPP